MKIRKSDDIISKYLNAESTLTEEATLFDSANSPTEIGKWSTYVKLKKKKAPSHLEDGIRAAIQNKKRQRQRIRAGLSGIAASIVLCTALFLYNTAESSMKSEEKEAILNEALSMFSEEKQMPEKQHILYEDDLVIVYVMQD